MEPPAPSSARPGTWHRTLAVTLGGAALALFVAGRLVTICAVEGRSMQPALAAGQRVLVSRVGGAPARGDLVVLRSPLDPDALLVKRVVGLPGERVETRGGRLFVGDMELVEPWVPAGAPRGSIAPVRVPPGHLFVLGDNRPESVDSRTFGPVEDRLLVGRVVASLWRPAGE